MKSHRSDTFLYLSSVVMIILLITIAAKRPFRISHQNHNNCDHTDDN